MCSAQRRWKRMDARVVWYKNEQQQQQKMLFFFYVVHRKQKTQIEFLKKWFLVTSFENMRAIFFPWKTCCEYSNYTYNYGKKEQNQKTEYSWKPFEVCDERKKKRNWIIVKNHHCSGKKRHKTCCIFNDRLLYNSRSYP